MTATKKTYFTLAVREAGRWAPQFGDYDRAVVAQELDDLAYGGIPKRDMRIVKSADDQASILAAVATLKAKS